MLQGSWHDNTISCRLSESDCMITPVDMWTHQRIVLSHQRIVLSHQRIVLSHQCIVYHISALCITSVHVWSHQWLYDHISNCMITSAHVWSRQCMCDHISDCMITSVIVWSHQHMCDHVSALLCNAFCSHKLVFSKCLKVKVSMWPFIVCTFMHYCFYDLPKKYFAHWFTPTTKYM